MLWCFRALELGRRRVRFVFKRETELELRRANCKRQKQPQQKVVFFVWTFLFWFCESRTIKAQSSKSTFAARFQLCCIKTFALISQSPPRIALAFALSALICKLGFRGKSASGARDWISLGSWLALGSSFDSPFALFRRARLCARRQLDKCGLRTSAQRRRLSLRRSTRALVSSRAKAEKRASQVN